MGIVSIFVLCFLVVGHGRPLLPHVSFSEHLYDKYYAPLTFTDHQNGATTIVRNVGTNLVPSGSTPKKYTASITSRYAGITSNFFQTAVEGISFSTNFALPEGTYDVELGFVQVDDCVKGDRIFHVYVNDQKREESLDVFETAGCAKALVLRYNSQIVDHMANDGIKLSFDAVSGVATLSYIRIRESTRPCVPEISQGTPSGSTEDHFAHSVPGTYPSGSDPSFVDRLGLGYFRVKIDGTGSHTHFFSGNYTAKIKSYTWTRVDTGKVISMNPVFFYNFPLGTTILKLKVVDTICSEHEATTSVTVTGNVQSGAICYVYDDTGSILQGNSLTSSPRPTFSFTSPSLNIKFPLGAFRKRPFGARCIFLAMVKASSSTKISIDTALTGTAHLYRGSDRIYDTSGGEPIAEIATGDGHMEFEMTYRYDNLAKPPVLVMKINGTSPSGLSHDASRTIPIITALLPNNGPSAGGSEVRITGYNMYRPVQVFFGSTRAILKNGPPLSTEVTAIAPPSSGTNVVAVKVQTSPNFVSNELSFSYQNSCDNVNFEVKKLVDKSGKAVAVSQPTAVTIAHDGNLYVGTVEGYVHRVSFDPETSVVQDLCHSEKFQDSRWKNAAGTIAPRAFLGITVDPRDAVPRPYVSASTLFYHRKEVSISKTNLLAWSNGAIERFKPATAATLARDPKQCLEYDKNIVQGLPVADGDHSVNQILFSQTGDLLIAVAGRTNMGLPKFNLGGSWETYFSGAVLVARLSKSGFNGNIPYTTPTNLRTAKPVGGYDDVDFYATGFRNPFSISMSRAGNLYAGDNGPNRGFGDASTNCSEYNETAAANGPVVANIPGGGAVFENGEFSDGRQDKIMWVKEGKFYGHPNIQRSVILGVDECAYIDPLTGKTPPPGKKPAPANYEPRLVMVKSPVTGVLEYGGNEFCGQLRGTLLISKPSGSETFALKLGANGKAIGSPYSLIKEGGLSVVEDSIGSLIFPNYFSEPTGGFVVLKPLVTNRAGLHISGVTPYRHGKKGGNQLHIGGRGFSASSIVTVGGKTCSSVRQTGTLIVCKVPAHTGGALSVDVSVKNGTSSVILKQAVLYMQV